ncbi:L,D-transpeptidase [Sinomicrobium soli]|uniref:L,D-transpeptidase n=1 Tax=Sinomicrobium sp. N-1-3-6 TaxID=2219864 RepID=UPI000DCBAFF8|nr:L,D-transpeptidase [Sinomicrobium sp. N-1-3-6]RAV28915.1 L,D-transpeptidase [Sinomicrobium sp. N-1-3-6]
MNMILRSIALFVFLGVNAQHHPDNNNTAAQRWAPVLRDITIGDYFNYMDSLADRYRTGYPLTEHLLVRANPRIIDSLADTDYYRQMARDSFVYDQKKMIALHRGDSLLIPDSMTVNHLLKVFANTLIDINIPEFKLRIYEDTVLVHTFPVRVGKNMKRFLAMGNRETNLRTISGEGTIVRHERNPVFYNPVNGRRFYLTKRDDEKTTVMPRIPWIETEINGVRNGQMIHPTTNPETLGKAYSNGCIGTREADMWYIYYNAPIGTAVRIRYDLEVTDEKGNSITLKDIYSKYKAADDE